MNNMFNNYLNEDKLSVNKGSEERNYIDFLIKSSFPIEAEVLKVLSISNNHNKNNFDRISDNKSTIYAWTYLLNNNNITNQNLMFLSNLSNNFSNTNNPGNNNANNNNTLPNNYLNNIINNKNEFIYNFYSEIIKSNYIIKNNLNNNVFSNTNINNKTLIDIENNGLEFWTGNSPEDIFSLSFKYNNKDNNYNDNFNNNEFIENDNKIINDENYTVLLCKVVIGKTYSKLTSKESHQEFLKAADPNNNFKKLMNVNYDSLLILSQEESLSGINYNYFNSNLNNNNLINNINSNNQNNYYSNNNFKNNENKKFVPLKCFRYRIFDIESVLPLYCITINLRNTIINTNDNYNNNDYNFNYNSINLSLNKTLNGIRLCYECNSNIGNIYCLECDVYLCEEDYNKIHKTSYDSININNNNNNENLNNINLMQLLENHSILKVNRNKPGNCMICLVNQSDNNEYNIIHQNKIINNDHHHDNKKSIKEDRKTAEFYCYICCKSICGYCRVLGSHSKGEFKNHVIESLEDAWNRFSPSCFNKKNKENLNFKDIMYDKLYEIQGSNCIVVDNKEDVSNNNNNIENNNSNNELILNNFPQNYYVDSFEVADLKRIQAISTISKIKDLSKAFLNSFCKYKTAINEMFEIEIIYTTLISNNLILDELNCLNHFYITRDILSWIFVYYFKEKFDFLKEIKNKNELVYIWGECNRYVNTFTNNLYKLFNNRKKLIIENNEEIKIDNIEIYYNMKFQRYSNSNKHINYLNNDNNKFNDIINSPNAKLIHNLLIYLNNNINDSSYVFDLSVLKNIKMNFYDAISIGYNTNNTNNQQFNNQNTSNIYKKFLDVKTSNIVIIKLYFSDKIEEEYFKNVNLDYIVYNKDTRKISIKNFSNYNNNTKNRSSIYSNDSKNSNLNMYNNYKNVFRSSIVKNNAINLNELRARKTINENNNDFIVKAVDNLLIKKNTKNAKNSQDDDLY